MTLKPVAAVVYGKIVMVVPVEDLRAWLKGTPQDNYTKEELCGIQDRFDQETPDFKKGFVAGEVNITRKLLASLDEKEECAGK